MLIDISGHLPTIDRTGFEPETLRSEHCRSPFGSAEAALHEAHSYGGSLFDGKVAAALECDMRKLDRPETTTCSDGAGDRSSVKAVH